MSRNKDIKLLHQMTGLPYAECRKKMKEHHWDVNAALSSVPNFDILTNAFLKLGKVIQETLKRLDPFKEILKALEEDLNDPESKVGMLELNFHDEVKKNALD